MSNTKYPGSDYQELFNHLHNEHGLILLESQMQDIIHIVNKMKVPDRESELIEMLETIMNTTPDKALHFEIKNLLSNQ